MDIKKITFYVSTGLLTALMLFAAYMYIFTHANIVEAFQHLGYPTYLIYPLAVAKILGLIAIWSDISKFLKNLAYAGFFYDTVLAYTAHFMAGDGAFTLALLGIILVAASYITEKEVRTDA